MHNWKCEGSEAHPCSPRRCRGCCAGVAEGKAGSASSRACTCEQVCSSEVIRNLQQEPTRTLLPPVCFCTVVCPSGLQQRSAEQPSRHKLELRCTPHVIYPVVTCKARYLQRLQASLEAPLLAEQAQRGPSPHAVPRRALHVLPDGEGQLCI